MTKIPKTKKIKIFEKLNIKINLGDLDIYFVKKIK